MLVTGVVMTSAELLCSVSIGVTATVPAVTSEISECDVMARVDFRMETLAKTEALLVVVTLAVADVSVLNSLTRLSDVVFCVMPLPVVTSDATNGPLVDTGIAAVVFVGPEILTSLKGIRTVVPLAVLSGSAGVDVDSWDSGPTEVVRDVMLSSILVCTTEERVVAEVL